MTDFIPTESVKFNKRLTDIEQHPDKVVLRFADGAVGYASVLVGADGIKSMVREHVLKPTCPTQVEPVYADAYCYRGVIPMQEARHILGDLTDVAKFYFGHKRSAVTYRITGGEVSWTMPEYVLSLTRYCRSSISSFVRLTEAPGELAKLSQKKSHMTR